MTYTKKNGKDNGTGKKVVGHSSSYDHFSEDKVNTNDLYYNNVFMLSCNAIGAWKHPTSFFNSTVVAEVKSGNVKLLRVCGLSRERVLTSCIPACLQA